MANFCYEEKYRRGDGWIHQRILHFVNQRFCGGQAPRQKQIRRISGDYGTKRLEGCFGTRGISNG